MHFPLLSPSSTPPCWVLVSFKHDFKSIPESLPWLSLPKSGLDFPALWARTFLCIPWLLNRPHYSETICLSLFLIHWQTPNKCLRTDHNWGSCHGPVERHSTIVLHPNKQNTKIYCTNMAEAKQNQRSGAFTHQLKKKRVIKAISVCSPSLSLPCFPFDIN